MKVIHLLRKPCSEGTVAANVLRWGTGALNVDASRISALPGEHVSTHARSPEASAAVNRPVDGEYGPLVTHQTEGQKLGRWPANVLLQHLPGCERLGVKQVKVIPGGPSSGDNAFGQDSGWNRHKNKVTGIIRPGNGDGTETVAAWTCEPGCPVAALDAQSGVVGDGAKARVVATDEGRADESAWRIKPMKGTTRAVGDTGGASRFFKQFGGSPTTATPRPPTPDDPVPSGGRRGDG
ncbi:MAG: hypothetical protein EBT79_11015 [Actinobacteria bacterium]|nr:hypothetical protein [Actinomycetota bacterium]NBR67781.1 hypothetical protein [Actinomycetota bacterium]